MIDDHDEDDSEIFWGPLFLEEWRTQGSWTCWTPRLLLLVAVDEEQDDAPLPPQLKKEDDDEEYNNAAEENKE